jgi:hypothetical protein
MYCLKSMSTDVTEVRADSIIRAMPSETTVDIDLRARQYVPEDSELQNVIFFLQPIIFPSFLKL